MKRIFALAAAVILVASGARAADEISAAVTLKVEKGYLLFSRSVNTTWSITNANPNISGQTQSIGTSAEAITLGDVAVAGVTWFRNLSTNRTVEIGAVDASTNFLPLIKLKFSEYAFMRLGTNVVYAKGIGGSVVLEKAIVDE